MIPFTKYQGTGNDFIMINHFEDMYLDINDFDLVAKMCNRHFGIGADGLIVLEPSKNDSFYMRYYNADGRPGSFCGNGSRCTVAFAHSLGVCDLDVEFSAFDGKHRAQIEQDWIWVQMNLNSVQPYSKNTYLLDTGSPHYVRIEPNLSILDPLEEGRRIRYSAAFAPEGLNVNFVTWQDQGLQIRTYERGVEDLTLSCGTGITAAAIARVVDLDLQGKIEQKILADGGELKVRLERNEHDIHNVWLGGPALSVFTGTY